ncbi:hypothetical protein [Bacillus sp. Marseille-P3800]|uniref:hypothetical protein n=1 Tax=Bacillus sp. Marseille-P3800 TaxID=2014782 RepID=UPI000C0713C5|nr:hypothetical protein [Bacillus sp. Marseille-P3800]
MITEGSTALALKLAEIAGKSSINWVSDRLRLAKETKDNSARLAAYEEIITELVTEKGELERIANEYKVLYEKINLSDENILHLQKTVSSAVEILSQFNDSTEENKENIRMITELINKDTIKTMQLLGFNYAKAIGEPLTLACASAIKEKLGPFDDE